MLWLPDSGRRTENADSPLIPPESDLRPAERQQNRSLPKHDTFGLTATAHLFPYTAVSACGSLPWPCVSTQESEPGRVRTTEHRSLRPRSDLLPYLRANTKMSQIQNRAEKKMFFFLILKKMLRWSTSDSVSEGRRFQDNHRRFNQVLWRQTEGSLGSCFYCLNVTVFFFFYCLW